MARKPAATRTPEPEVPAPAPPPVVEEDSVPRLAVDDGGTVRHKVPDDEFADPGLKCDLYDEYEEEIARQPAQSATLEAEAEPEPELEFEPDSAPEPLPTEPTNPYAHLGLTREQGDQYMQLGITAAQQRVSEQQAGSSSGDEPRRQEPTGPEPEMDDEMRQLVQGVSAHLKRTLDLEGLQRQINEGQRSNREVLRAVHNNERRNEAVRAMQQVDSILQQHELTAENEPYRAAIRSKVQAEVVNRLRYEDESEKIGTPAPQIDWSYQAAQRTKQILDEGAMHYRALNQARIPERERIARATRRTTGGTTPTPGARANTNPASAKDRARAMEQQLHDLGFE